MKNSNRQTKIFFVVAAIFAVSYSHSRGSEFTDQLNSMWQNNNATQILTYVTSELNNHTNNPQILAARAIVSANLEQWLRGATNQLHQVIEITNASTNYTSSRKQIITQEIAHVQGMFSGLASDLNEPANSTTGWSTQIHSELFGEIGDEFPYLDVLELFDETE